MLPLSLSSPIPHVISSSFVPDLLKKQSWNLVQLEHQPFSCSIIYSFHPCSLPFLISLSLHIYLPQTSSFTLIFFLVMFVILSTKRNSRSSLNSTWSLYNQVSGKRFFTYVLSLLARAHHAHTHTHNEVPVTLAAIRRK
jgi:hypothetical protein